jgi:hypothetical protein
VRNVATGDEAVAEPHVAVLDVAIVTSNEAIA